MNDEEFNIPQEQVVRAAQLLAAADGLHYSANSPKLVPFVLEVQRFLAIMRCIAKVVDNAENESGSRGNIPT